eukprot:scaffold32506_cov25-Tisochrysis_lutea.AAC.1
MGCVQKVFKLFGSASKVSCPYLHCTFPWHILGRRCCCPEELHGVLLHSLLRHEPSMKPYTNSEGVYKQCIKKCLFIPCIIKAQVPTSWGLGEAVKLQPFSAVNAPQCLPPH